MSPIWPLAATAAGVIALDRLALATTRPPRRPAERDPHSLGFPCRPLEFDSVDGIRLRGHLLEPDMAEDGAPLAVLVHGWTGNASTMLHVAEPLLRAGVRVLLFDVRRHGRSDTAPFVTVRQFRDDVARALDVASELRPASAIVAVGHSLGGAAAVLAAAGGAPVDGLALLAAPADLFEATASIFRDWNLPGAAITRILRPFWRRRAGEPFADLDPERRIAEVRLPLLLVQGDRDRRVPVEHARRLSRAAGVEVTWVPGADHRGILASSLLHASVVRFVRSVAPPVEVVAAVVRRDGRWLVARRPAGKRHGGLWEFPGGKLRSGEDRRTAVARELREELGLDLRSLGRTRLSRRDPGAGFVVHFVEAEVDGEPVAHEHEGLLWATHPELRSLALAPADRAFVECTVTGSGDR